MTTGGYKTALELALAEAREAELAAETQGELFAAPAETQQDLFQVAGAPAQAVERRGPGRPLGSRSRTTIEAGKYYMRRYGDPLERAVAIAAMPVLAPGVLEGLAQRLQCSRHDAAKWWAGNRDAVLPYLHTRLSSVELRPPGAPGGEVVSWTFADDGELVDVTPPNPTNEDQQ
jgi:hypothetical protein